MAAYIVDTETNDKYDPQVIEFASIRIPAGEDIFDKSDLLIPQAAREVHSLPNGIAAYARFKPTRMSNSALAIHHILPSELEDCPPSSEAPNMIEPNCEYMIGHSIDFDWEALGKPKVKRICTHAMAQWLWPDASGYSQSALLYMLDGPTPETRERLRGAHGASVDVQNNQRLLAHILQQHPGIDTWEHLWEYSEECRIPRTCPMKRHEGVLLENLDFGFIDWCLNQDWLDPYFRKGLEKVIEDRGY